MTWREQAACVGLPTDWWFPTPKSEDTRPYEICGTCTVRKECLDDALETREFEYGIRAGMTPEDRRKHARKQNSRSPWKRDCTQCGKRLHNTSTASTTHPECTVAAMREKHAHRKNAPMRPCLLCGMPLDDDANHRMKYHPECGLAKTNLDAKAKAHAERGEPRVIACVWCGDDFTPTHPSQKYHPDCRRLSENARQREYMRRQKVACAWCGRLAPVGKTMHARCAAEQKTATHLHQKMQETALPPNT